MYRLFVKLVKYIFRVSKTSFGGFILVTKGMKIDLAQILIIRK